MARGRLFARRGAFCYTVYNAFTEENAMNKYEQQIRKLEQMVHLQEKLIDTQDQTIRHLKAENQSLQQLLTTQDTYLKKINSLLDQHR